MKQVATAGLLLVLCLVSAAQESDTTFKVDVKLVNVFVTVTDEHGAPIAGLKKDNFELQEDGKEQKIAVFDKESALPLSIVLAIDTSLSTRKDLPLELASARRFAHAILRPVDALVALSVQRDVSELTPFTSDLRAIDRGIDRIRLGSATALYDALFLGSQALEPRQGRKVMVVITDGGDTMSKVDYQEAVRAAETAEAILYSIIVVPIEASAGRDTGGEHALIQLSRRHRRQVFLCVFVAATGRRLSPDQRRTAHSVLARVLSFAAACRFRFPPHPGKSQRANWQTPDSKCAIGRDTTRPSRTELITENQKQGTGCPNPSPSRKNLDW